jgi:hypothetical protein
MKLAILCEWDFEQENSPQKLPTIQLHAMSLADYTPIVLLAAIALLYKSRKLRRVDIVYFVTGLSLLLTVCFVEIIQTPRIDSLQQYEEHQIVSYLKNSKLKAFWRSQAQAYLDKKHAHTTQIEDLKKEIQELQKELRAIKDEFITFEQEFKQMKLYDPEHKFGETADPTQFSLGNTTTFTLDVRL